MSRQSSALCPQTGDEDMPKAGALPDPTRVSSDCFAAAQCTTQSGMQADTSGLVSGRAARSKHSQTRWRRAVASSMDLKNMACSFTPCSQTSTASELIAGTAVELQKHGAQELELLVTCTAPAKCTFALLLFTTATSRPRAESALRAVSACTHSASHCQARHGWGLAWMPNVLLTEPVATMSMSYGSLKQCCARPAWLGKQALMVCSFTLMAVQAASR